MSSRREDHHFSRFRATGDPSELARVFDLTAAKLLQVAVHLTADAHAAEDVVQATFLAAIQSAPRYRADAPVLSWLLGILANRVHYLRRQERRRADSRRLTTTLNRNPDDPASLAAGRELAAACAEAVDRLPESYAQVLELHLTHGLSAKEIARVLRRPAGTVRTQVVRGMELLRKVLPAGFAVGGAVATTSTYGLAAVRRVVLDYAQGVAPAAGAGAATATGVAASAATGPTGATTFLVLGGVLLMKKGLMVAAAAVCVALVGWYSMSAWQSDAASDADRVAAQPERSGDGSGRGNESVRQGGSEQPANTAAEDRETVPEAAKKASDGRGTVHVQCVWASDGSPISSVVVRRYVIRDRRVRGPIAQTETDDRGAVTFADVLAGSHKILGSGTEVNVTVIAGAVVEVKLEIPELAIQGTVVDENRHAVAGATIEFSGSWQYTVATTGHDGKFRGRVGWAGHVWARKPGSLPSRLRKIGSEGAKDLVFVLPGGGSLLTGTVLDPDSRPVSGARVAVPVDEEWVPAKALDGSVAARRPPVTVTTDESGRFRTEEVPPGKRQVFAHIAGFALGQTEVEVPEAGATNAVVRLRRGATVHGVLLDFEGKPIVHTSVIAFREQAYPGLRAGVSDAFSRLQTTSDASGRFRLNAVTPGPMWLAALFAQMPKYRILPKNKLVVLKDGETLEWNPNGGPPGDLSIKGGLQGPGGAKLANWRITTRRTDLKSMQIETADATTDAAGRFELRGLRDLPYKLTLYLPGQRGTCAVREGVRPGGSEFVWQIRFRAEDLGSIVGKLLDAKGKPATGVRLSAYRQGVFRNQTPVFDGGGGFRIENLTPGTWGVKGYLVGYGSFELGRRTVSAHSEADFGTCRLHEPGRVVVHVRGLPVTRGIPAGLTLEVSQPEPGRNKTADFTARADGSMRSAPLPPGRYTLLVTGADIAPVEQTVRIEAGEDTKLDVRVERAAPVRIRLAPEGLDEKYARYLLRLHLTDANGKDLVQKTVRVEAGDGVHTLKIGLRPGAYEIEGSTFSFGRRIGRMAFRVPDGATALVEVRVPLAPFK